MCSPQNDQARPGGTSPDPEDLYITDAGTVSCPNYFQPTTRNQGTSAIYARKDIIVAYLHYCNLPHDKSDMKKEKEKEKEKKKKNKKVPKPIFCWSSTCRKAKRAKQAANKKVKKASGRVQKFFREYIRIFILIKGILALSAHVADVGTDGNTAYSHYNNEDLEPWERRYYGSATVVLMVLPMIPAFIVRIRDVNLHSEWSSLWKRLMVLMCILVFPANAFLILLWDVMITYRSQDPHQRSLSARKAGAMKMTEVISESLPQTWVQLRIVSLLLHKGAPVPTAVWRGIASSIASLAFAMASNDVFGGNAATASRALWFVGCVVGIPARVAVWIFGDGPVVIFPLALTYSAMAMVRYVSGDKLKWTPQYDKEDVIHTIRYRRIRLVVVCLGSWFLCRMDSCCSFSSLPVSGVTLIMAVWQFPYPNLSISQPVAISVVVLAAVSFIMNLLLTAIPQLRGVGDDWDNAWDSLTDKYLKWLKQLLTCQPNRGNDDTNDNCNETDENSDDIDNDENYNYNNAFDNNGYDNKGYDNDIGVADGDDNDDHSDDYDTDVDNDNNDEENVV